MKRVEKRQTKPTVNMTQVEMGKDLYIIISPQRRQLPLPLSLVCVLVSFRSLFQMYIEGNNVMSLLFSTS